jgi:hypothetical protein
MQTVGDKKEVEIRCLGAQRQLSKVGEINAGVGGCLLMTP